MSTTTIQIIPKEITLDDIYLSLRFTDTLLADEKLETLLYAILCYQQEEKSSSSWWHWIENVDQFKSWLQKYNFEFDSTAFDQLVKLRVLIPTAIKGKYQINASYLRCILVDYLKPPTQGEEQAVPQDILPFDIDTEKRFDGTMIEKGLEIALFDIIEFLQAQDIGQWSSFSVDEYVDWKKLKGPQYFEGQVKKLVEQNILTIDDVSQRHSVNDEMLRYLLLDYIKQPEPVTA